MISSRIETAVETVTVYRRGARVVRSAVIEAGPEGFPAEISVPGLPLCIDDSSVRVRFEARGKGPAPEAREVRIGLDAAPKDSSLPPPRDEEIESARLAKSRLEAEIERIERLMEALQGLSVEPRPAPKAGTPPGPLPTEARITLLDFRRKRLEAADRDLRKKSEELDAASRKLEELEFRKETSSTALAAREHETRKSVVVRIAGLKGPAEAVLKIEYLVPGATWAPSYILRFDRLFSKAALSVRASVCQRTGENWKAARLALSTAEPCSWTELPKLPALKIGRAQPEKRPAGWRDLPAGLEALFADYDAARITVPPLPAPAVPSELSAPSRPPLGRAAAAEEPEEDEDSFEEEAESECLTGAEPAVECCFEASAAMMDELPPQSVAPPEAAPMRRSMPAPSMLSSMPPPAAAAGASMSKKGFARMEKEYAAPQPPPPQYADPGDLLAFGNLRLRGPDEPGRGKLKALSRGDALRDLPGARGVAGLEAAADWISRAVSAAQSAADAALPPGLARPASPDGFDYAFACDSPADVPSDGAYHTVSVREIEAVSSMTYVSVPRESADVFRSAEVINPADAPLLPGPADVIAGGDFLMTVPMGVVGPGGRLEIGLGVEQGVKVARNTSFSEQSGGLLGGKLGLLHRIEIEVANNLAAPATVEIRERIPVRREGDKEVEVEVSECKPPWKEFNQREVPVRGAYGWRVRIEPGGREKLLAAYNIRISSKKEISGGNRREN